MQSIKSHDFNLIVSSYVVYICLFDVKFAEDELKEIETCRNISKYYLKVYW